MDDAQTATFLTRLWTLAGERGLTDGALASLIGVSHPYLSRLKRGQRKRPGLRVVLAAIHEFPELGSLLSSDLRIGQSTMPMRNDEGG